MTHWKRLVLAMSLLLVPALLFGQGTITGTVVDASTQSALGGASVMIVGTSMGAATNSQGHFKINNVPAGTYTVKAMFIGYNAATQSVTVTTEPVTADFSLEPTVLEGSELEIAASRAVERETPVAFTNLSKAEMQATLGSRDIPMVLNETPSVYATQQGGGAGDARINVRGFDQRNVVIMINGVPVNDMENGWVYWSNWDGIGDATSSIQMQRGMSAVTLAVPSIGGTMNVITDPTQFARSGNYRQEFGNDGFLKGTLAYNSGMLGEKFAFNALAVRKVGNGLVDKTWIDNWAYSAAVSYQLNASNRLELYAIGAPQRHGQNLYKQNIAVYDQEFAKGLDSYDQEAFTKYNQSPSERRFNQNWAPVDPAYNGLQAVENKTFERYDANFLMERENFFHKPQVNLNWFSQLSNRMNLYTILYYSGGRGGGTGTLGSVDRVPFTEGEKWYKSSPWMWDWNSTIGKNQASTTGSRGILRNSRNNQWTLGAIVRTDYKASDAMKLTFGIDARKAEIDHYREVRDLLGGDYYKSTASDFWTESEQQRGLGDKVNYFYTNNVNWFGFYGQAEYSKNKVTAYATAGYSGIGYKYNNHFKADDNGNPLNAETGWISGGQIKGGASYRATDAFQVFANLGYVSKVPIFDSVIDDRSGSKAENPQNEKFLAAEAGVNYFALDNKLVVKFNGYYTVWQDRARSINIQNEDGSEGLFFLSGMDLLHTGLELEMDWRPIQLFRLIVSGSVANWKNTNDVSGVYKDYGQEGGQNIPYNFYVKDLRVGDAPQTQLYLGGVVYPTSGLSLRLDFRGYANHYAGWDPFSRDNELYPPDGGDRGMQSWKAPNYTVFDFHAFYNLPINFVGVRPQLFVHVFNIFDTKYIQDATDNSRYSAWDKDHDADDAEVFFGQPQAFNLGFSLVF